MIKGISLYKTFHGFVALDHTDINVPKGAVYGLVGPNGAGKTTLLRNLVGVMKPDSGEALLEDSPIYENPEVKSRIAYIPDDVFYYRQSTLKDLKEMYQGIYPAFDETLYHEILDCFPEIKEKQTIRRMSKGMQKQVAFMIAVCCKPEVLVLDEPVDGLDPVMRRQIWKILLEAVEKEHMTVIVSSHNLRELEDVCDYVGVMHHGKIVLEQSLSSLQEDIHKVQIAYSDDFVPDPAEEFKVLNHSTLGRVHTYIIRGYQDALLAYFQQFNPLFVELLPLSLEEIFIFELGGEHYEVKEILM